MPRRFKLHEEERVLWESNVALAHEGKSRLARFILTNERIVIAMSSGRRIGSWLGLLWRNLAPKTMLNIVHEIRRDRFASVEPGDGGILVFHDSGEGYGHVSFTLTPDLFAGTMEPLATWQQRMHAWSSGERQPATLPSATVVDK